MLVPLGGNDSGCLIRARGCVAEGILYVERYCYVMHVVSTVFAEITEGADELDISPDRIFSSRLLSKLPDGP